MYVVTPPEFTPLPPLRESVAGDLEGMAADALAVLRTAVGQNVNLNCTDTTPSRVRFYNDIDCNSGSDVSARQTNESTGAP